MRPCASTWLGAGTAYLNLRDLQQADLCLMEANTLNNQVGPPLSSPTMHASASQLRDVSQCVTYSSLLGSAALSLLMMDASRCIRPQCWD